MKTVWVVNGPNLNLLGQRETLVYGTQSLSDINKMLLEEGERLAIDVTCFQSNHEGALIEKIHEAASATQGLIINPGGYTHTSVALRDALAAYHHPIIEVHLSNLFAREPFRHHSYVSPVATAVICGLQGEGYRLALLALAKLLASTNSPANTAGNRFLHQGA
jgi:3-dehydroquinate dehydratase-2